MSRVSDGGGPAALLRRPITSGLAIGAIGATALWWSGRDLSALFLAPEAIGPEPWRLVTSVLPHVSVMHLVFNVWWLPKIGGAIEERCGAAVAGALVLLTAIGSGALELALFDGGVGLSGVGYGQALFAWTAASREPRLREVVDARVLGLFGIWFVLCIVMTATGSMPVANAAHAGGAILGALAGLAWARGPRAAIAGIALAVATIAIVVLASPPIRPWINLGDPVRLLVLEAHQLATTDPQRSRELFERVLELDPESADGHAGLGYALTRLGEPERGLRELERGRELDPGIPNIDFVIGEVEYELGRRALEEGRAEQAVAHFERGLGWVRGGPDDVVALHGAALAAARLEAGDREGARAALAEADAHGAQGEFVDSVRAALAEREP